MSEVKVVIETDGIQELMKSTEVQQLLTEHANEIISRCSGSYEADIYVGKTRANASIKTRDKKTFFKNLKDNELLKALR